MNCYHTDEDIQHTKKKIDSQRILNEMTTKDGRRLWNQYL